jgi:hypothetical protein
MHLANLEELNLVWCKNFTDSAIEKLPTGIKNLNLSGCNQVNNASFEHLINLEELNLAWCEYFTDTAIEKLPRGIKKLNLTGCSKLSSTAIVRLSTSIHIIH